MTDTKNPGKMVPDLNNQGSYYTIGSNVPTANLDSNKAISVSTIINNNDIARPQVYSLNSSNFNPIVTQSLYCFNPPLTDIHNQSTNIEPVPNIVTNPNMIDSYSIMNLNENLKNTSADIETNQLHFNTNFGNAPTRVELSKNIDTSASSLTELSEQIEKSNDVYSILKKNSVKKRKVVNKPEITKNGKYREKHPEKWLCNQRRKNYAAGKSYLNRKGKFIPEKEMKPPCTCKMKCYEKILPERRLTIFNNYWSADTNNDLKRQFVRSCIETYAINRRRKRNGTRPKGNTLKYTFLVDGKRLKVCKVMFLNTLCISNTVVNTIIKKKTKEGGIVELDKRGRHEPSNKIPESVRENVRNHIASLSTYDGIQINIKKSRSKIEKPELSIEKMYHLYLQFCIDNNIPSDNIAKKWLYTEIFNKNS